MRNYMKLFFSFSYSKIRREDLLAILEAIGRTVLVIGFPMSLAGIVAGIVWYFSASSFVALLVFLAALAVGMFKSLAVADELWPNGPFS